MHSSFGYDLLEPVRRDFSTLLEHCDHDLHRAVAEAALRRDYTFFEHARDLAGAARWNAKSMIRRGGTAAEPGPEQRDVEQRDVEQRDVEQRDVEQRDVVLGVPRARSEGQAAAAADGTGHATPASG